MRSNKKCTSRKLWAFILTVAIILAQLVVVLPTGIVNAAEINLAQGKPIVCNNYTQTYVATNANDGNVNTYWEGAANSYPNTLTVDLGSAQTIAKVNVKLPVAWGTRTQTFAVLGSTDNVTFNTLVNSALYTFTANNNVVTVTFTSTSQRYVRLSFTTNSGSTGGQVSEFEVTSGVSSTPTPTPTPVPGKYEAENAALSGGAKVNTDHTGYSGTGFVDGMQTSGSSQASFTVNVATAGSYNVDLRYANSMGVTETGSIYVNGTKIRQTSLPNLADWNTWSDKVEALSLNAGNNTIAYKYDSSRQR